MLPTAAPTFDFTASLLRSQAFVDELTARITAAGFTCLPPEHHKHPDIRVMTPAGQLVARVEAKHLSRLFNQSLKYTGLAPEDCLTVDATKFQHYLAQSAADQVEYKRAIPTFICFDTPVTQVFQDVHSLAGSIPDGVTRAYTRRAGVDESVLGRRDKTYFSVRDCEPLDALVDALLVAAAAISQRPTQSQYKYARDLAARLGYAPRGLAQVCRVAMASWLAQAVELCRQMRGEGVLHG